MCWQYKAKLMLLMAPLVMLMACGGTPSSSPGAGNNGQSTGSQLPDSLQQLQGDPALIADIPHVVLSETLADTGLQVAYTRASQLQIAPSELIERQWVHMQTCLQQTGVPPVVLVREGPVTPFTASDDVIYTIDITPVASSSRLTVPVIQIDVADFDGSLGNPGFNLRSIAGRLLWLSAGLAERDYPFACARESV